MSHRQSQGFISKQSPSDTRQDRQADLLLPLHHRLRLPLLLQRLQPEQRRAVIARLTQVRVRRQTEPDRTTSFSKDGIQVHSMRK